jgi:hypothetical protein
MFNDYDTHVSYIFKYLFIIMLHIRWMAADFIHPPYIRRCCGYR